MRSNLAAFRDYQVFLNFPFDADFEDLEIALQFTIVAAGLIPVCAKDISVSDRPRIDLIFNAIRNCQYSVHEFSRNTGEGKQNYARMNMPLEMGMALFQAMDTKWHSHRCAFFVPTSHDHQQFASDLAGLDPPDCHNNDPERFLKSVYKWIESVVPEGRRTSVPMPDVVEKYHDFCKTLKQIKGSGDNGQASYDETRELMYKICEECKWWDFRETRQGKSEFPTTPIAWHDAT